MLDDLLVERLASCPSGTTTDRAPAKSQLTRCGHEFCATPVVIVWRSFPKASLY
uniref:Uncharacterized protein n=1 Tax=Zea mays TaxID=4577 RepID=B6U2H8_MAIZE|nr:hypothetical protein [Zea mays]